MHMIVGIVGILIIYILYRTVTSPPAQAVGKVVSRTGDAIQWATATPFHFLLTAILAVVGTLLGSTLLQWKAARDAENKHRNTMIEQYGADRSKWPESARKEAEALQEKTKAAGEAVAKGAQQPERNPPWFQSDLAEEAATKARKLSKVYKKIQQSRLPDIETWIFDEKQRKLNLQVLEKQPKNVFRNNSVSEKELLDVYLNMSENAMGSVATVLLTNGVRETPIVTLDELENLMGNTDKTRRAIAECIRNYKIHALPKSFKDVLEYHGSLEKALREANVDDWKPYEDVNKEELPGQATADGVLVPDARQAASAESVQRQTGDHGQESDQGLEPMEHSLAGLDA